MKRTASPLNPLPRRVRHEVTKNLGYKDDKWARGNGRHGMARSYGHNSEYSDRRSRRELLVDAERNHDFTPGLLGISTVDEADRIHKLKLALKEAQDTLLHNKIDTGPLPGLSQRIRQALKETE